MRNFEEHYCVVCGQGSLREDWVGKDNPACDFHAKEEVDYAIKAKQDAAAADVAASQVPAEPAQKANVKGAPAVDVEASTSEGPKPFEASSKKTSKY